VRRLLVPFALLLAVVPAIPASAQAGPVELVLAEQTPWTSPRAPLELVVRAHNSGTTALQDLTLTVGLYEHVRSRSEYHLSLTGDATGLLTAQTEPLLGSLDPGTSRTFGASMDLEAALAPLGRAETGVFPVTIELRSGSTSLAVLRTPVVHLHEKPANPLLLAWTFVLHAPLAHGPDGTYLSPALERAISIGAPLSARVAALARMLTSDDPVPVDVVVSPTLVSQLEDMRDGYSVVVGTSREDVPAGQAGAADAERVLAQIRSIVTAPAAEVAALPFSVPSVPAMVQARMAVDLRRQVARGVEEVATVTGASPDQGLYVPPDSIVDEPSLARMVSMGRDLVLLDAGQAAVPSDERGFVPPPVADVSIGSARTVAAVVPDPEIQAMLASGGLGTDPRLGVQRLLGLLASMWLEQPGTTRGVALMASSRLSLPPSFYRPMVAALSLAPWLRRTRATDLAVGVPKAPEVVRLAPAIFASFSDAYVGRIRAGHEAVRVYVSVLVDDDRAAVDELEDLLLLAESSGFVGLERIGLTYVEEVEQHVRAFLDAIDPASPTTVTLAARTGLLNVGITNDTGAPVRVVVRLQSSRLTFLEGPTQQAVVEGQSATFTFRVHALTTGQFPVRVRVETPTGDLMAESQIVVRSTAFSQVALILTIGAALYLAARAIRLLVRRSRRTGAAS
jgi:hypothetical protein